MSFSVSVEMRTLRDGRCTPAWSRTVPVCIDRRRRTRPASMRCDAQHDAPVVDQDDVARLHVLGEPLVHGSGSCRPRRGALARRLDQRHLARRGRARRRRGKRSARGSSGRTGPAARRPAFCSCVAAARSVSSRRACSCVAAVREVEARDVHARADELLERLAGVAGRADGADDLGSPFEH